MIAAPMMAKSNKQFKMDFREDYYFTPEIICEWGTQAHAAAAAAAASFFVTAAGFEKARIRG